LASGITKQILDQRAETRNIQAFGGFFSKMDHMMFPKINLILRQALIFGSNSRCSLAAVFKHRVLYIEERPTPPATHLPAKQGKLKLYRLANRCRSGCVFVCQRF